MTNSLKRIKLDVMKTDPFVLFIVALLTILFGALGLCFRAMYAQAQRREVHHCVAIRQDPGGYQTTLVTVPGPNGTVSVVPTTTYVPGPTTYRCEVVE